MLLKSAVIFEKKSTPQPFTSQLKKNQYAYRVATFDAKGIVPEMLKKILTKLVGEET